jgi:hypothetical protein
MKGIGIALWLAGLSLFGLSLALPTSVETAGGIGYLPDRVVNMDLMQRQMLAAMAGVALFVVGSIVHAFGTALERAGFHAPASTRDETQPASSAGRDLALSDDLLREHGIKPEPIGGATYNGMFYGSVR